MPARRSAGISAPRPRSGVQSRSSGPAIPLGQGWGIDPARGGMRTYRTMRDNRPDFFIHSGDHIYADCPVPSELKLPNGEIWRNIVTEEKSVVAHSLAQFRGNYKYNWLDENLRAFHAEVPMFAQWDDHEVTNDWSPIGSADETGYAEDGTSKLVARARRAFFEFMPIREMPERAGRVYRKISYGPLLDVFLIDMRSYRDSTWNKRDDNSDTFILGREQLAWLKRELLASNATWKVIAADLPIGLISEDAVALGDGPPERREHEIADLLVLHEARRHQQHRVADRRHALHGRASLRSEPRGVFRFRAVLGIRLGSAACRHLGARRTRQYVRPQGDVPEGLQRRAGRKSQPLFRTAILRPRRHRRQDRNHDRDPEGCRQHATYGRSISSPARTRGPVRSWRSISELTRQDAAVQGVTRR